MSKNKNSLKIKNINRSPITVPQKKYPKRKKKNFRVIILLTIILLEIILLTKVLVKRDVEETTNKTTEIETTFVENKKPSFSDFTIFLDPGHGFSDDGTLSPSGIGNINESETVLDIGLKVKEILLKKGFNVVLSRETNYDKRQEDELFKLRNEERVKNAENINADIYVSLHVDALDEKIRGFEEVNGYTIYYCDNEVKKSENIELLAKCIMDSFVKETNVSKIQIKSMETDEAFYVVNHTTMPSVLFELGYCTNKEDAKRLADEKWKVKAANGISNGILEYFNKVNKL